MYVRIDFSKFHLRGLSRASFTSNSSTIDKILNFCLHYQAEPTTASAMNSIKFLIGVTFALLITGIVLSYKTMKQNEITDPIAAEIQRLEAYKNELTAKLEQPTGGAQSPTHTPYTPSATESLESAAEMQATKEALERTRQELEQLRARADKAEEKADLANNEAGALAAEVMDQREPSTARANSISQALLMARISSYDKEQQIASIFLERPDDVVTGMILGIRRNAGIAGRVKVGTIQGDRAIADPIPGSFFDGEIDLQEGDELIVPPDFE